MDLGIINGYVCLEGRFIKSNLYIKNGVIESVTSSIMHCSKVYDAKGCIIMPGFIDPHVHFNLGVGKNVSAQDFHTGSINAALGGITTYIDFLDPINNISELDFEFNKRKKQAEDSVIDYGFHVTLGSFKEDVKELFKKGRALGMPTIKIFTTYESTGRMTKDNIIDELLKYSKEYECRVVVHAENNDLIKEKNILVKDHEKARPAIAEISEVLKLCEMAAYRNGLLYIVHTNCGTTVERVRENFKDSLHSSIILESAPHYFKFNSSVYEGENGYRYTMMPPLREESERLKLKDNIDGIDIIGTDHCPFSEHMKNKKYTSDIAMGVDGVKYSFLNMYTLYKEKIIPKFTENPAIIHGLYPKKGSLMVGSDGDIVVFDPNNTTIVNDKESIYDGQVLKGSIKAVFAKGNMIVNNNEFLKNSSSGSYIERRIELDKSFNKCRYI